MTDDELAQAIMQGDVQATTALIDRFHAPLVRYLWSVCHNRDDAHDLAGETLLLARSRISTYRGGGLQSWVFRIGNRQLLHRRRADLVRLRWLQRQPLRQQEAPGDDSVIVLAALSAIPPKLREAFVLCEAIGLTVEEASISLGVPVGTVKSRCHYARQQLQRLLSPSYPELMSHEKPIAERS